MGKIPADNLREWGGICTKNARCIGTEYPLKGGKKRGDTEISTESRRDLKIKERGGRKERHGRGGRINFDFLTKEGGR